MRFISNDFNKKIRKSRLSPGDVVIVRTGKPGTCAVIPDWLEVANCSDLVIVRCGPEINNRFLSYYVNTVATSHVNAHLVGAVQQHFNVGSAKTMKVLLPPIFEQKRIVGALGALDDKIELNRQMNTTLEAMAQALFKSWFVDFDPVIDNALAAGNPIPATLRTRAETRKGLGDKRKPLPEAIQKQFPSRFIFSEEMGWIPEGWEVVLSGDVIDVRDGTHDSPQKAISGFPLVTSRHITSGTLRLSDTYLISDTDYIKVNQRSKVEHGDILLTMIGTVGIPYLVMQPEVNFAIKNIGLFRTSQASLYRHFFYQLLKTREMQNYLDARMAGTTQKYLSLKVLRNIEFVSPGEQLLSSFKHQISVLMNQLMAQEEESSTLATLRDTLLPKLLSGQLRIPDAEKLVADAL